MKLIYRIALHISWVLSLLLAAWAVLFYFMLIGEVNDEVDDSLEHRSETIIKLTLAGRESSAPDVGGIGEFYLKEVSADYADSNSPLCYTDERIFIPGLDETEPARVLRTIFRDGQGRYHELTVMSPAIEKDDLQGAILHWMIGLYLFLLVLIVVVNVLILYRMLRPLYALLRWLDGYTVGGENAQLVNDTEIVEFRRLNEAARGYANRAEQLFERQKQFIGNASHEMQTPLAVCRNRLELLVDEGASLSEEQLTEIAKVQRTLDGLVRLNRSLLLLSKIENGQVAEIESVDLNAVVRRTAEDIGEAYASRGIVCTLREQGQLTIPMSASLAASLVANLLKNAFVHGAPKGEVEVEIDFDHLQVSNSGLGGALDGERVFDRFFQGSKQEGSTGLGLSIVDAICRLYAFRIEYTYIIGRHCFTVWFRK